MLVEFLSNVSKSNLLLKQLYSGWLCVCIFYSSCSYCISLRENASSIEIAKYETQMWKNYYERDFDDLINNSVKLLIEQFDISMVDAMLIATSAAQAARVFSRMPKKTSLEDYKREVLPSLILSYRYLSNLNGGNWDPDQAALLELEWWIARRTPGKNQVEQVGKIITNLYAYLYGNTNEHMDKAGYYRALAANLRDKQSRKGRVDWQAIETLLQKSYHHLLVAIKFNN